MRRNLAADILRSTSQFATAGTLPAGFPYDAMRSNRQCVFYFAARSGESYYGG